MKAEMTAQLSPMPHHGDLAPPGSVLHQSDQGNQYTGEQFQRLMTDHSITSSTSRSDNVWDNAAMESFF
jgi:putative transposase